MIIYLGLVELTLQLDHKKYDEYVEFNAGMLVETNFGYLDETYIEKGIGITYHEDTRKRKIKFYVYSPSLAIKDNNGFVLMSITHSNITKLINKLEKRIREYFANKYTLYDFDITRLNLVVNFAVGADVVHDYIKVLHNIKQVKFYRPMKYGKRTGEERANCFGLNGVSSNIEFRIYASEQDKKNLRAEVRLSKKSVVKEYTDCHCPESQLRALVDKGKNMFMGVFIEVIPPGDFYKKAQAEKLIHDARIDWSMRHKMFNLMRNIKAKKSLYAGEKCIDYRKVRGILEAFNAIGVSPITISKRHKVKHLKSFYDYI